MAELSPQDAARIRSTAVLNEVLPYLQSEIDHMERAVINRTFKALDDGTLTPQGALNSWIELQTIRRFIARMMARKAVGQVAAEQNASALALTKRA